MEKSSLVRVKKNRLAVWRVWLCVFCPVLLALSTFSLGGVFLAGTTTAVILATIIGPTPMYELMEITQMRWKLNLKSSVLTTFLINELKYYILMTFILAIHMVVLMWAYLSHGDIWLVNTDLLGKIRWYAFHFLAQLNFILIGISLYPGFCLLFSFSDPDDASKLNGRLGIFLASIALAIMTVLLDVSVMYGDNIGSEKYLFHLAKTIREIVSFLPWPADIILFIVISLCLHYTLILLMVKNYATRCIARETIFEGQGKVNPLFIYLWHKHKVNNIIKFVNYFNRNLSWYATGSFALSLLLYVAIVLDN